VLELLSLISVISNTGASAIAKGAIMRAQNKQLGPERIPTHSIGIYRHINWEEDSTDACITRQKAQRDGEGEYVIKNTILWIIKKVRINSVQAGCHLD
jgi:hypothetical protein